MKKKINSIRVKLFLILTASILSIVVLLILVNTFIYEPFYSYSKQNSLLDTYKKINNYYNEGAQNVNIHLELEKLAETNGIDIIIKSNEGILMFATNKDFLTNIAQIDISQDKGIFKIFNNEDVLYSNENTIIKTVNDKATGINYMVLSGKLDNGNGLYMRLPLASIQESAKISNTFLYMTGICIICISAVLIPFISRRFTNPILELDSIAKKMANLDFSKKYRVKDTDDEINNLGRSINRMSSQLEKTIRKLQETNAALEKDIEKKSKIDEMRKQFISDVSHELKTPIALIQGYAEGLKENVNTDEESRKFYAEVILDEASKMDQLVKKLLELMKLEYQTMEFSNMNFNIIELISEVIRKSKFMLEEANVKIKFNEEAKINVYADEFYIEQVITNYLTNAIKNVAQVNGEKFIEITVEELENTVRIAVFNTGNNINIEDIPIIWNRFYKADTSRKREDGGTGIGLAFVKAIMNNYDNRYGVINKENGVEFYIELGKEKTQEAENGEK